MNESTHHSAGPIIAGIIAICAATVVAYLPAMRGGWLWDDDVHVTRNPALRDAAGLGRIWFKVGVTPQYYPLTHSSFWLQYQIWKVDSSLPYHLANVLLHSANALLVWLLLSRLGIPGAWLAAAIFALHPVHVESVAWVTERKNVLSGFFYLLGAIALLRSLLTDRIGFRWYAAGAAAFIAALLSKTVTATLPAAVLVVLVWKQGRLRRDQVLAILPLLMLGAAMGQLTAWMERSHVGARGAEFDLSILDRFRIAGAAVWFYLGKLLLPMNQSFIYERWEVGRWGLPGLVFPAAVMLFIALLYLARRRIGSAPLAAFLLFIGTLFPALGFVNVYPMRYSFVADHFQYLASIAIIALVASLLSRLTPWNVIVPVVLLMLTLFRAGVFADEQSLWSDTLEKNDGAWIAHDQLGAIALERGDVERAAGHFSEAIRIEPRHHEAYSGLATVFQATGDFPAAVEQMRKAVAVAPNKPITHFTLAGLLAAAGDFNGAIDSYQESIRLDPSFAPAHLRLADVYDFLGRAELAAEHRRLGRDLAREWLGSGTEPASR